MIKVNSSCPVTAPLRKVLEKHGGPGPWYYIAGSTPYIYKTAKEVYLSWSPEDYSWSRVYLLTQQWLFSDASEEEVM